jgi:uncharacterized membrane protein (UPF0127 family)
LLFSRAGLADGFFKGAIGLMFKKSIKQDSGLLIYWCNSIHTFFMRFAIDAIFLDKNNRVVRILSDHVPWRFGPVVFGANKVLEVNSGQAAAKKIKAGDNLYIKLYEE